MTAAEFLAESKRIEDNSRSAVESALAEKGGGS